MDLRRCIVEPGSAKNSQLNQQHSALCQLPIISPVSGPTIGCRYIETLSLEGAEIRSVNEESLHSYHLLRPIRYCSK